MNRALIILFFGLILCIIIIVINRRKKEKPVSIDKPVIKRYVGQCATVQRESQNDVVSQALTRMLPTLRIVRGTTVNNKFSFVGALLYEDTLLCGSCLIHPNFALGAAHCISYLDLNILFKSSSISKKSENSIERKVRKIIPHPDFNTVTFENDICMFEFEPVTNVLPACLPYDAKDVDANETFIVAGWGETESSPTSDVLMETTLKKSTDCITFDDITEICAVNDVNQSGPCVGDSGSPLFYVDKNETYVICGVVSKGSKSCTSRPTTFTKVHQYLPWITSHF